MSHKVSRRAYADLFGPTVGDRIRLGDTGLIAEVTHDSAVYGDECKFGGGKVLRDGMGQAAGVGRSTRMAMPARTSSRMGIPFATCARYFIPSLASDPPATTTTRSKTPAWR